MAELPVILQPSGIANVNAAVAQNLTTIADQNLREEYKETVAEQREATHVRAAAAQVQLKSVELSTLETENAFRQLREYTRHIDPVSGSDRDSLRNFIRRIDHCKAWSGVSDEMIMTTIGALVLDPLAKTLRDYRQEQQNVNANPTWAGIKTIIRQNFLSEREDELLREQARQIKQEPYEDSRTYSIRYKTAVQRAYSADDRDVSIINQDIIKRYVLGFRDPEVRMHIFLKDPQNLDEAIETANSAARAVLMSSEQRDIQNMELGAFSAPIAALPLNTGKNAPTTPNVLEDLKTCMNSIKNEIRGLRKEMKSTTNPNQADKRLQFDKNGKTKNHDGRPPIPSQYTDAGAYPPTSARYATSYTPSTSTFPPRRPLRDEQGRPLCYICKQPGHFKIDCPHNSQKKIEHLEMELALLKSGREPSTSH